MLANRDARREPNRMLLLGSGLVAGTTAGVIVAILALTQPPTLMVVGLAVMAGALVAYGRPRAFIVIGGLTYIAVFHWSYLEWVSPIYAYSGLITVGVDWPALTVVSLLAVLPVLWLPTALQRPSGIVLWFLYLFGYVPACTIPIHLLGPELGSVLPFTILVTIGFATLTLARRIPLLELGWRGISEPAAIRLLVALSLASAAYLVLVFGIPTRVPDLETVYDARADYAAVADVTPGAGYLIPWAGNVIFPLLMALGLARSRAWLLALGVGGEVLVYATTGFKTVLFSLLLVPALWVAIRWGSARLGGLLAWGAVGVVAASIIGTVISGSIWPLALFVTRLLAVPGQMTAYYLDFFTTHPGYELSRSVLRAFGPSPYEVDPPYLIGAVYIDSPGTHANANIWADAVANYGLAGIVPFTLVLGFVLWLLDSVSAGRDLRVVGPILGLAGISLGNSAVFASILTLGLGLTIVLVALMPDTRRREGAPTNREGPQPRGP